MSQNKLKQIFWKSFKMSKYYRINLLLIHVKEKEQAMHANNVVVLNIQTHTPILNGIVPLETGKFFLGNQMEIRQENVDF